jgi:hypothetical protein
MFFAALLLNVLLFFWAAYGTSALCGGGSACYIFNVDRNTQSEMFTVLLAANAVLLVLTIAWMIGVFALRWKRNRRAKSTGAPDGRWLTGLFCLMLGIAASPLLVMLGIILEQAWLASVGFSLQPVSVLALPAMAAWFYFAQRSFQ